MDDEENKSLESIITSEDILSNTKLVDYQVWLDPVLNWSCRCRYEGRDIAWLNAGTLEQLMTRVSHLEFMCYVDVARGLTPR